LVSHQAEDEQEANAQRIVDCVNGCEGINPKAAPQLLEACKEILNWANDEIEREGLNIEFPLYQLQQAIASAEGGG
jgi:hypothetical protein